MNPVAMTIISPGKGFWPSRGSNLLFSSGQRYQLSYGAGLKNLDWLPTIKREPKEKEQVTIKIILSPGYVLIWTSSNFYHVVKTYFLTT